MLFSCLKELIRVEFLRLLDFLTWLCYNVDMQLRKWGCRLQNFERENKNMKSTFQVQEHDNAKDFVEACQRVVSEKGMGKASFDRREKEESGFLVVKTWTTKFFEDALFFGEIEEKDRASQQHKFLVDPDTGMMYYSAVSTTNGGGVNTTFFPLIDAEGKPKIYNKK